MSTHITAFESDAHYGMLEMYHLISKTSDAIRNIENEGFYTTRP